MNKPWTKEDILAWAGKDAKHQSTSKELYEEDNAIAEYLATASRALFAWEDMQRDFINASVSKEGLELYNQMWKAINNEN